MKFRFYDILSHLIPGFIMIAVYLYWKKIPFDNNYALLATAVAFLLDRGRGEVGKLQSHGHMTVRCRPCAFKRDGSSRRHFIVSERTRRGGAGVNLFCLLSHGRGPCCRARVAHPCERHHHGIRRTRHDVAVGKRVRGRSSRAIGVCVAGRGLHAIIVGSRMDGDGCRRGWL